MKRIIIGEITETKIDTPINIFEWGLELAEQDEFDIQTNNAQLIELLELMCGEDNLECYIRLDSDYYKTNLLSAYNYIGELYDTIDSMRCCKILEDGINMNMIYEDLKEYKEKYSKEAMARWKVEGGLDGG